MNQPAMSASAFTLAAFTAASPYMEGAALVYIQTWPGNLDDARAFIARYARKPGFCGQVAIVQNQIVGMGFGHRSLPGDWWHDHVAALLGDDHPALQDTWVLVELALLAQYRGRGIGSALHQALLQSQPCARALLSTEVTNTTARRLYERLGWQYVHYGYQFSEDGEPFVIMSRTSR